MEMGHLVRGTALCAAAALVMTGTVGCSHDDADDTDTVESELAPGRGAVHGSVEVKLKVAVALPDARIQLRRSSDGLLTPAVITDINGNFIVSNVLAGTYSVCITGTVGFASTCNAPGLVVTSGKIAYALHTNFVPAGLTISGRIRLSDANDVRYANELFGKQVETTAKVVTPAGALVAGPVRANSRGEYLLRHLVSGSYRVIVQSESTTVDTPFTVGRMSITLDVTLPNKRPAVHEINALQGGQTARHVAAGSIVKVSVRASDPDGQPLHYRWIAPRGGSCPNIDAPSVDCTMPTAQGVQPIYVQVSDGAGQYETGKVRVSVGPALSLFSGRALDGATGVPGAEIQVNGTRTFTNANGGFSVTVAEGPRYVVTIKKDGYQLISKVFHEERTDALYPLLRDEVITIDPRIDNTIAVRPPKRLPTAESGYKDITVVIRANSIIDDAGNRVTTPVNVFRSRFDHLLDPFGRMPGDNGAINKDGKDVTLTSFGALELNLRGPGGERYNLAAGMPADLDYPVPSSQLASALPSLPLWYYNERTGLWEEDGTAVLSGSSYKAQAKHFSAINVDLQKSNATCLKIVVDQTKFPTLPIKIRLTIPGSPVVERSVTENVNAIVRLPPNIANSRIVVLDPGNNPVSGSERVFTTGDSLPDGTNLSLPSPYNVCITPPSPPVTLSIDLPQNPSPIWLTRMQNPGANDTDRNSYATAYYTAIAADLDLTTWKNRNEFSAGDDAAAFYYNAGDLEFGRSMHMNRRSDGGIAYYVTNYETADKAFTGAPGDVIATVAMEYSKYPSGIAGAPRFTKFYVFNKDGNLVNSAELDSRGDKYVPGLCVMCHGGRCRPISRAPRRPVIRSRGSSRSTSSRSTRARYTPATPRCCRAWRRRMNSAS
jgi:hypothetical protein